MILLLYMMMIKIIALRDLKVNCKRIHVIPNGVDINKFYSFTYENKLKIREKEGFSHHDIIIGMLGRLWEQKNPLFLLRAFNIISKKFPNVKLVYIGDGDLKKDILECISYEGLTDKVKVLGWREDTEFLLNILDIFVLPSKWEGMPLAILEAQSVELPCLVSDIPGNRHIVKNNKTGLLFNLNNIDDLILNLDKVIINQSVRKFLGEEAREDVCRNHNIDKRIQIIHNLYQKRLRME
ncbi:GDP-mannose-dependent alpha-(1-6)-phosphatidylinositol monomannoside mannosyltransferase [Leminorella grimontii]|uniref:glycosyltransferase n=1 Tax=Leminorella grimontii TaxID=82981 RepID=UPI0010AFAE0E|nr:glycosyltransferase [Leminorella grimontii]VFS57092.1 GDP-mannose-dependent alpha-(1-6)-phosphatidylinositol monomannoside mannosyltransferase [Leminorella grimontii]